MAKPAKRLTKTDLDKLRRQAEQDPSFTAHMADAGQPGLVVRARRGRVRFVFEFKPPGGGLRRRMDIDLYGAITLDQAREAAQRLRATLAVEKVDPQEKKRREAREGVTVADAVEEYLTDLLVRAEGPSKRGKRSSHAEAKRRLERHVVPRLGRRRLRDVAVPEVRALHNSMKATPVEANRMLSGLSAVFGFAARQGNISKGHNPCDGVEEFEETGERRALTGEELERLGAALQKAKLAGRVTVERKVKGKATKVTVMVHPSALLALQLLALTGFRRAELIGHSAKKRRGQVEGLRWGDVDLQAGVVVLRDSKTGRQRRVIGRVAVDLLVAAKPPGARDVDPICPGVGKRDPAGRVSDPGPLVGIDKARRHLYEAARLEGVDLHSLRHTFASIGGHVADGRYAHFVGPLLGHGYTKVGITDRYITSDLDALRPAADAIADEIALRLGLVERGKVLQFPQATA